MGAEALIAGRWLHCRNGRLTQRTHVSRQMFPTLFAYCNREFPISQFRLLGYPARFETGAKQDGGLSCSDLSKRIIDEHLG